MTTKQYKQLIPNRIFIGGINAIDELLTNEKVDVIYDLRANIKGPLASKISVHQPLVDEADQQEESIKVAVQKVIESYNEGKNIYFHCNTGNGRGGTLATATLLELGLADSVEEAEQKAQIISPTINVRPQFKEALKRIYDNK